MSRVIAGVLGVIVGFICTLQVVTFIATIRGWFAL